MSKRDRLSMLTVCALALIFKLIALPTGTPTADAAGTLSPTATLSLGLIAFTSDRDGSASIYVMKADGSSVQPLTKATINHSAGRSPAWSPDGKKLAYFSATGTGRQGGLYVLDVTSGKEQLIAPDVISPPGFANHPAWSPDGNQIAFAGTLSISDLNASLYIINSDGQNEYILAQGNANSSNLGPSWSPDGLSIVYWTPMIGSGMADTGTISVIAPNGSSKRQISNNGTAPAWSPDGKHIAYTSRSQLFIMDADGKALRQIARATDGLMATSPTWSADGRQIAYAVGSPSSATAEPGGAIKYQLFVVDMTGDNLHSMTQAADSSAVSNSDPAWSPAGLTSVVAVRPVATAPATATARP